MTAILKQFDAFVPYFMNFSFQVLRIISEKAGLGCASRALLLPSSLSSSKSKYIVFLPITNRLNSYL